MSHLRSTITFALAALLFPAGAWANPSEGAPSPAAAQQNSAAARAPFDPLRLIDDLASARDDDPIGYLIDDMDELTDLLAQFNTRVPVQPKQQQVIAQLDRLIAMLEKQCSGGGGSSPNPSRPMGDSVIAKGPGGAGPLHDPTAGTKTWGQLSPKQRDQILQSQTEGFPPEFEAILSSYYRRLAQDNVADPAAPASDAQPGSP